MVDTESEEEDDPAEVGSEHNIWIGLCPAWGKKPDPGLCTSNEGRFLKFYFFDILENFNSFLIYFHTLGVRRTIDVLYSETSPDPAKFGSDPRPGDV